MASTDWATLEFSNSNVADTPITSAPASARASAKAFPIPRLQPVTKATFPDRSNVFKIDISNVFILILPLKDSLFFLPVFRQNFSTRRQKSPDPLCSRQHHCNIRRAYSAELLCPVKTVHYRHP